MAPGFPRANPIHPHHPRAIQRSFSAAQGRPGAGGGWHAAASLRRSPHLSLRPPRGIGAVARAGGDPRDGASLAAAMRSVTFDGMSGFVRLDDKGDRYNDVEVAPS